MYTIIWLGVIALLIWWNVEIAKKNGRNTILAGFMAFFFGIISIVIYILMGKTEAKKKEEIIYLMNIELEKKMKEEQRVKDLVQAELNKK